MEKIINKFLADKSLDIYDLITVTTFVLATVYLLLGLSGHFIRPFITLFLGLAVFFLFLIRKKFNFNPNFLYLLAVTSVVLIGFAFLRGAQSGDTYESWLPLAKSLSESGQFPDFYSLNYFSRPPLLVIILGAIFSIFNSANEFLVFLVPIFFTTATLGILIKWLRELNIDKIYIWLLPIIFLLNGEVAGLNGWGIMQESVLLFFGTYFFYYFDKYLKDSTRLNLFFMIIGLVLAAFTKEPGIFLAVMIMPMIFLKSNNKKQMAAASLLFLPVVIWFIRNYLLFDNPIFPILNDFFRGQYWQILNQTDIMVPTPDYLSTMRAKYWFVIKNLIIVYPFLLFGVYYLFKKRRYNFLLILLFFFLFKELFLFSPTSAIRYYYIFTGLFIVYGLKGLYKLRSKLLLTTIIVIIFISFFQLPLINSTSLYISGTEMNLAWLKQIIYILVDWRYLLYLMIFIASCFAKKEKVKLIILLSFCFSFVNIEFLQNKSWLAVWPFILFLLFCAVVIILRGQRKIVPLAAVLTMAVIIETWGMGYIYVRRHGFSWPVEHLYRISRWADGVMNAESFDEKNNYLLLAGQPDYFNWFSKYQSVTAGWFNFNLATNLQYSDSLNLSEVRDVLIKSKIKYIIYNSSENMRFNQMFEKISADISFLTIAQDEKNFKVMKVY